MIDYFAIGLTHALMLLAAWRMLLRDDLDREDGDAAPPPRPWLKAKAEGDASDA